MIADSGYKQSYAGANIAKVPFCGRGGTKTSHKIGFKNGMFHKNLMCSDKESVAF